MPDKFERQTLHTWSALCRIPEDDLRESLMTKAAKLDHQKMLDELAAAGLIVSFEWGKRRGYDEPFWSVRVLKESMHLAVPLMGLDFEHAIEIAHEESKKRGWL